MQLLTPVFIPPSVQLVLEAHNVPELSAGVNCTFEDLAEMNGLVEGNRIKCSSPAEKEMPRVIVDKGKEHDQIWKINIFCFYCESNMLSKNTKVC